MPTAVCLISGGIDSSVTAYIAKNKGFKINSLSFDYGQIHKKELSCAKEISRSLNAENHIVFNLNLKQICISSLLDEKIKTPLDNILGDIGKDIPITYVPGRNTIFLSIGLSYAESLNADAIFIGATSQDYSGYPDCRPEYIHAFQKMADIATKRGLEGRPIKIESPLLFLNKSEIIRKGVELDVPFDKTWSCYIGERKACGRCDSCLLRLKGFLDAKAEDPIEYEFLPHWYKSK